jgi:L-lysine exporter family protein LysE/ArgO
MLTTRHRSSLVLMAAGSYRRGVLTALTGFLTGLGLIVAIGAQNVFVLRQGLRRQHVGVVIAICAASDAVLVTVGVAGVGRLTDAVPWLLDVVRWAGAAFLLGYAVLAARRAWRPATRGLDPAVHGPEPVGPGAVAVVSATRLAPVALTALALTWLNPHVYLDTVFLLGSLAAGHGQGRWWFAAGAVAASLLWFTALGLGARHLGRWLRTPRAWRVLDGAIAVVMVALAVGLLVR